MAKTQDYYFNDIHDEQHWRDIQQELGILGNSSPIRQLIEIIEQVAPTNISVLVSGESGTGKELVAKAVHTRSRRSQEPLITVNCGAIPEGILESELFGHEKGSFTGAAGLRKGYFELADKGSIFLDEIGELPPAVQAKLLRVLENREFMRVGGATMHSVDVRFVAATNRNLEKEVRAGNFRQDLYFRLNAMHIPVPSLRERREDIALLAKKFAQDFCRNNYIEFEGFTDGAMRLMENYSWPGNVRELRNVVEKVIVLERGKRIDEHVLRKYVDTRSDFSTNMPVHVNRPREDLDQELLLRALLEIKSEIAQLRELLLAGGSTRYSLGPWTDEPENSYNGDTVDENDPAPESVPEMEREMIVSTLKKTGGNKRKAAKILGMSERTLYRKINKYGLRDDYE